ncbi:MAG: M15 family metallopeptidase [Microthrixaceae bacterium]
MTRSLNPSAHVLRLRPQAAAWFAAAVFIPVLVAGVLPAGATQGVAVSSVAHMSVQTAALTHQSRPSLGRSSNEVDVLTASREEVAQKIQQLEAQYVEQQTAVADAEIAVGLANEAVGRARARVTLADNEVEIARQTVRAYAVEAYITPPAEDALRVLSVGQSDDASYANEVIKIMADDRHKVVDILVGKRKIAADESATADAAAAAAADQVAVQQAQLGTLEGIRSEQDSIAAELEDRLDAALAEAAALAEIDQQMASELAAQEIALVQSVNTPSRNVQQVTAPAPSGPIATVPQPAANPTVPATSPGSTAPGATPPTPASAPPTTQPAPPPTTRPAPPPTTRPAPPPAPAPSGVNVTSVGGITVNVAIAGQIRGLLDAATAAGLNLRGGGYRSSAAQIATRRNNCGPSYYDIYQKPSSQCSPPTAIPGRSMHEQGRAIDFTSAGSLITSRSNPAFIWLSRNASRFGMYNLPSEPWHWSTNGK